MKKNHSVKDLLNNPIVYSSAMRVLGSGRNKIIFIRDYVRPKSGDTILDFGCGPATILDYLPLDIVYTGLDFNEEYIESAKKKYGSRGTFIVGDASQGGKNPYANQFDIVLAHGLIHHLSDSEARIFLKTAYDCLKKNGRLITVDNVDDEKIGLVNKIALKMDRGAYIRKKPDYLELFSPFSKIHCDVVKTKLRIPYYHIICEVTRQ